MAEFQKTLSAPEVKLSTPQLQTNTGSTATDVLAGAQFLMQGYQNVQKAQQQEAVFAQQAAQTADYNAGAKLATQHLDVLGQVSGTKQSLKKRQLQQQAIANLSPTGLQGYLEVNKASGIKLAVAEEQEALQELQQAQQREHQDLLNEGMEIVMAQAVDSSPQMLELYKKYGQDGYSDQELTELALINRGTKAIAQRESARISAEKAALGLEQDALATETKTKINEYLLSTRNRMAVPSSILNKSVASSNPSEVITAQQELKRNMLKEQADFTKFLSGLTAQEKGSLNLTGEIQKFEQMSNQFLNLVDSIDPVKTNSKLLELTTQQVLAGQLLEGGEAEVFVAHSLINKVSPDREIAALATKQFIDRTGGLGSGTRDMLQSVVNVQRGVINSDDEATPRLIQKSQAPASEKAVPAAKYTKAGTEGVPVHKPGIFESVLDVQEQVSRDPEAVRMYKASLEADGLSVIETIRDQHSTAIQKTVWPSLSKFGIEQGSVRFVPTKSGINFEMANRGDSLQATEPSPFVPASVTATAVREGTRSVQEARKALNRANSLLNRMAKVASSLAGVSESDVYAVYAESINRVMGVEPIKPEEPIDGKGE